MQNTQPGVRLNSTLCTLAPRPQLVTNFNVPRAYVSEYSRTSDSVRLCTVFGGQAPGTNTGFYVLLLLLNSKLPSGSRPTRALSNAKHFAKTITTTNPNENDGSAIEWNDNYEININGQWRSKVKKKNTMNTVKKAFRRMIKSVLTSFEVEISMTVCKVNKLCKKRNYFVNFKIFRNNYCIF